MNEQLKQKAEQIFRNKYEDIMIHGDIECFKKDFETVYNGIIIPSIVQALEDQNQTITDEKGNPVTFWGGLSKKHVSKIQPGQKLKDGDYFEGGTAEQYEQLFIIENVITGQGVKVFSNHCIDYNQIVFESGDLNWNSKAVTKYSLEDFRQLCINTFGDGSV